MPIIFFDITIILNFTLSILRRLVCDNPTYWLVADKAYSYELNADFQIME